MSDQPCCKECPTISHSAADCPCHHKPQPKVCGVEMEDEDKNYSTCQNEKPCPDHEARGWEEEFDSEFGDEVAEARMHLKSFIRSLLSSSEKAARVEECVRVNDAWRKFIESMPPGAMVSREYLLDDLRSPLEALKVDLKEQRT